MQGQTFTATGKQVLCDGAHYADAANEDAAARIVAAMNPASTGDDDHKCFTVSGTAYLLTLSRDEMKSAVAVHYQKPPTKTENGTSFGLRFPMLVVPPYIEKPEQVAATVAEILNQHWELDQ